MLKSLCCSIFAVVVAVIAGVLLQATSMADLAPYESPVTGVFLPPMAVFKAATKVSAMVDKLAFALKPPPVQVMSLIMGFQVTQAMGVFARMQVAEAMEKLNPHGMSDVKAIASAIGADPEALRRVLRMLSSVHFVASDGAPGTTSFGNTAASKLMIKEAPGSLWGAAVAGADDHYEGWSNLEASVRKGPGTIAFDDKFGMDVWEYYKTHPAKQEAFARFMSGLSAEPNAAIAMSGANFAECGAIVDVGGGHGSLLADIVAAFPNLSGKATVLDMPATVATAPTRTGVAFKGGDFFNHKTLPNGKTTNCYISKVVLHDWAEEKAVKILKGITSALDAGNVPKSERKLFLAEQVLTSGDALVGPKVGLDVNMMVMAGGQERTEAEWAALLDKAGWKEVRSYPTRSLFTLMEAVPK